ncbi:MAG: hypothetical protein ACJ74E_08700 [Actinomycetes bacterium]
MAEYEEEVLRVLAEGRTQPGLEGVGAALSFRGIVGRQRAQRLLLLYLVHITGGDLALPQKIAFAIDRISAILESPGDGPIESDPDPTAGQLIEPIRAARDAIRECADRLDVVADTDLALALAAIPSQDATGTELRACCNAALDAHDAALVVLARWCDEHPGNVRSVSQP